LNYGGPANLSGPFSWVGPAGHQGDLADWSDGKRGDHVLLAPPFIVSESKLDEIADKLVKSINTAFAG
jgi:hypothetical protein